MLRVEKKIKICTDFSDYIKRATLNNRCIYLFDKGQIQFGIEFIHLKGLKEGDEFMALIKTYEKRSQPVSQSVYIKPAPKEEKKGWLSKLFGAKEEIP